MKSLIGFLRNNWALIVVIVLVAGMIPSAYKCGNDAMARKALAEKEKAATETKEIIEANNQKHYAEIDKHIKQFNEIISGKNEKVASLRGEIEKIEIVSSRDMRAMSLSLKDVMDQIGVRDNKIKMQDDLINLVSKELTDTKNKTKIIYNETVRKYELILDGKDKIISDLNDLFQDAKKLGSKRRIAIRPFAGWAPVKLADDWRAGIAITY